MIASRRQALPAQRRLARSLPPPEGPSTGARTDGGEPARLPGGAGRGPSRTALGAVLVAGVLAAAGCGSGAARSGSPGGGSLRPRWRWTAPRPSYVGMPGADEAGVAVTYGHSHVVCLDGAGRPRWTVDREHLRDVAPRLLADLVLVPTEEGVAALDRASGAVRWDARLGGRSNTPTLVGETVVVTTWEGSLVGLERATGRVAWRVGLPGPALGAAAGGGGVAVATWSGGPGGGAGAAAVDAGSGRRSWAVSLPPGGVSGPGLVADQKRGALVVVVAGDLAAHGLAVESGAERWRTPLEGAGSPEDPPLDGGGGRVLVAHRLGGMALLDAADGRTTWVTSTDGAAVRGGPAGPGPGGAFALPLDDGRLVVAGPGRLQRWLDPPGRVSGVASGPGGVLLLATREATDNDLTAWTGW